MKTRTLNSQLIPSLELNKEIVAKADSFAVNNLSTLKNKLQEGRSNSLETTCGSTQTTTLSGILTLKF
ncbi:hypothetical protein SAMN05444266_106145 [Chitinophaga jiangningensis]|uniref:Uncharacterized protein n=1 Tax=Chitinophaga jiangningensis TaxID=1419482 RepID=A0A1M7FHR7_9BACT|nr:hypothetical protein [Chitinophaga jiangningensis]SHM03515.1 hypothetical protein SAMN05444266_106145 [Chitinophaga jiangningensis]